MLISGQFHFSRILSVTVSLWGDGAGGHVRFPPAVTAVALEGVGPHPESPVPLYSVALYCWLRRNVSSFHSFLQWNFVFAVRVIPTEIGLVALGRELPVMVDSRLLVERPELTLQVVLFRKNTCCAF